MTFVLIFSSVLANLIASNALCLFLILNYFRKKQEGRTAFKRCSSAFFCYTFPFQETKISPKIKSDTDGAALVVFIGLLNCGKSRSNVISNAKITRSSLSLLTVFPASMRLIVSTDTPDNFSNSSRVSFWYCRSARILLPTFFKTLSTLPSI